MSRWKEKYDSVNSDKWCFFVDNVENLSGDDSIDETSVQEIFRLKKVVKYIDGLIKALDPELVPISSWDVVKKHFQAIENNINNYNADKNIQHVVNANNQADQLINCIRPYMVTEGDAATALREAVLDAEKQIRERLIKLLTDANTTLENIVTNQKKSDDVLSEIQKTFGKIETFERSVFGDSNSEGFEGEINQLISNTTKEYEKIKTFSDEIFVGDEETPSVKQKIRSAEEEIEGDRDSINSLLAGVSEKVDKLNDFYIKIFGKPDSDEKNKGLEGELNVRKAELIEFEKEQKERYEALNNEINSLLPGATSAGLASAYHDMKASFDQPIKVSSRLFYGAIAGLIVFPILLSIESVGGDTLIRFYALSEWDSILKGMLYKLPIYAPMLWLAFYASKRRSEYLRLQQEYAHKEALAKSYHSYKQQIEALSAEDGEMLKDLISQAIKTISYNASETLDRRHGDRHPLQEMIEKTVAVAMEKFKDKT